MSTLESYKKQYGVSRVEAIQEFRNIIADAWKDVNEECMKPTAVSMLLLLKSCKCCPPGTSLLQGQ